MLASIVILLCALFVPPSPQGVGGGGASRPGVERVLPRLVELMRAGIETREPNASLVAREGATSLFDGSYDYHSCIAAHWALLVIARVEHDVELERWVLARLGEEKLERERLMLAALERPLFTSPYEDAWLTMLLSELARREERDTEALRAFRREVESRLFAHLEGSDFPENVPPPERGGRSFNGFYRSWLFAWLQLAQSDPITPDAAPKLIRLFRDRVLPHRGTIAALDDPHGFDFLWVPAVLAIAERTSGVTAQPLSYEIEDLPAWPESVRLSTVHVLGLEISRVWPCALLGAEGDVAARRTFESRVEELLARRELWEEDFTVVTHWVPQFLWYGLWLGRGRP